MLTDDDRDWDLLIDGLRRGDNSAVAEVCELFGDRLERLADRHLNSALRRRVGSDDVAQSVCRTFFRRAAEGEFDLPEGSALWALLCAITLTKIREQARFHLRQKRSLKDEQRLDSVVADGRQRHEMIPGASPDPAANVEFVDQFEQVMARFTEEEQNIVDLKLQQFTNDEIAEKVGCSERTVRRLLQRVRSQLEGEFQTE